MSTYLILDLETGTQSKYNRKAHFNHNPIIAIGQKNEEEGHYRYLYPDNLKDLEIDEDILVCHNAKFDLLYLWHLKGIQEFFKRGGKVWCTMTAEYYLTGQDSKYASLRDLGVMKYGCLERAKLMEEYWEQGTDTKDIPKEIVLEDLRHDCLDTEKIYLQQRTKSAELNMVRFIEVEMDLLLSTIEMEYNGMYVNEEVLEINKKELEIERDQVLIDLNENIKRYWE